MPNPQSPNASQAQFQKDVYGCGAQFPKQSAKYPQSQDLDRYLSGQNQQYDPPISLGPASNTPSRRNQTTKHQFPSNTTSRNSGHTSTSSSQRATMLQTTRSNPMAKWQTTPRREAPWDGVGAVLASANGKEGKSSKRSVQSRGVSSVGAVDGSLEGGRFT